MRSEIARFLIVGGIAAAANIGSRIIFSLWVPYIPAITLAFCVGLTTGFLLNRGWVFMKSGKHWLNEVVWFTAINLIGLGQTILISWLLADHALPMMGVRRFAPEIAHSIGVVVPVFTSFLGHKFITFRASKNV
jgi:putative flippase GtrA